MGGEVTSLCHKTNLEHKMKWNSKFIISIHQHWLIPPGWWVQHRWVERPTPDSRMRPEVSSLPPAIPLQLPTRLPFQTSFPVSNPNRITPFQNCTPPPRPQRPLLQKCPGLPPKPNLSLSELRELINVSQFQTQAHKHGNIQYTTILHKATVPNHRSHLAIAFRMESKDHRCF